MADLNPVIYEGVGKEIFERVREYLDKGENIRRGPEEGDVVTYVVGGRFAGRLGGRVLLKDSNFKIILNSLDEQTKKTIEGIIKGKTEQNDR